MCTRLPARINLEPGVPVTTALFPRAVAAVTQELIVPGALPFLGYLRGPESGGAGPGAGAGVVHAGAPAWQRVR